MEQVIDADTVKRLSNGLDVTEDIVLVKFDKPCVLSDGRFRDLSECSLRSISPNRGSC